VAPVPGIRRKPSKVRGGVKDSGLDSEYHERVQGLRRV
jgi:hypothetical protein